MKRFPSTLDSRPRTPRGHRTFMVGVSVFIALIWIALICALVALAMDPAAFGRFIGRIIAGIREVAALSTNAGRA